MAMCRGKRRQDDERGTGVEERAGTQTFCRISTMNLVCFVNTVINLRISSLLIQGGHQGHYPPAWDIVVWLRAGFFSASLSPASAWSADPYH